MGGELKEVLRSLCCSNGWLYGVLWRIRSPESMLLMPIDAYYEEQVRIMFYKMLHQVHLVGEGIIGQVALSGKHRWISSDTYCVDGDLRSAKLIDNQACFQDTAELGHQFQAGIKTIVVIPVSSQSVVQFGSHQKIFERLDFVNHIKSLFRQLSSFPEPCLSRSSQVHRPSDGFASVILSSKVSANNVDMNYLHGQLIGNRQLPSPLTLHSSEFTSGLQYSSLNPCPVAQVILSPPNMQVSQLSQQCSSCSTNCSGLCGPALSTWSSEVSALTSMNPLNLSRTGIHARPNVLLPTSSHTVAPCQNQTPGLDSILTSSLHDTINAFRNTRYEAGKLVDTQHLSPLVNVTEGQPSSGNSYSSGSPFVTKLSLESACFNATQTDFNRHSATLAVLNSNHDNNLTSWSTRPAELANSNLTSSVYDGLLQVLGASSLSAVLAGAGGDVVSSPTENDVLRSFQNSTNPLSTDCDGKDSVNASDDLFGNLGDLGCSQQQECWEDLLFSVGDHSNLNASFSQAISELDVRPVSGSDKGFFSEFGLEQLLDAADDRIGHVTNHNTDDGSSISTITRAGSTLGYNNQVPLSGISCLSGGMEPLIPRSNSKEAPQGLEDNFLPKSLVSSWINGSYSESGVTVLSKRSEESAKVTRKRARPGESTRPRPKDRQQIQDRVKELREIVPSGTKCSIDALLDRTIKHMLFLQSVTKYADKLKKVNETKIIKERWAVLKDSPSIGTGGATWAFEVGGKPMVCPIIVEDLNPPGQMLVEMLCEEQGFFLEIAEIIRGFGLTILKGVMEAANDKIWARFVVEAKMEVTRMDIFMSLVQSLQQTSSICPTSQLVKATESGTPDFAKNQQCHVPLPVSLAEMRR